MKSVNRDEFIDKYFIRGKYDSSHPDWFYVRQSILKALTDKIPLLHGNILDIGCGIMPYREYILDRNKNVTKYIGLDFENAIADEYAMIKPDLYWTGNIIPLEDESVDAVLATEFFEHCPDPVSVSKEIRRVLRPGGLIFLTVPFLWNLHIVPYDEYRYTPFALQRILKESGFRNIHLESLGGWHASLAQMLALWHKNAPASPRLKTFLGFVFKPLIKFLIKKDRDFDRNDFGEGTMMTGITGTAYK